MEEFYIDVELGRGIARVQVDEVPSEQWDLPYIPQFIIEFYSTKGFVTLTLQLEDGKWYDRNTRVSNDDLQLRSIEPGPEALNLNYQSPLIERDIQEIGRAIARHMVVQLTAYMSLFVPVFPTPALN